MAVPRNFKNKPLSPMWRATGPLSPRQGATSLFNKKKLQTGPRSARRGRRPNGRQGVPPSGDRVPLYISPHPHSLLI